MFLCAGLTFAKLLMENFGSFAWPGMRSVREMQQRHVVSSGVLSSDDDEVVALAWLSSHWLLSVQQTGNGAGVAFGLLMLCLAHKKENL